MNDPYFAFGFGVALGVLFTLLAIWPAIRWRDKD
jgi:hypothetical protein